MGFVSTAHLDIAYIRPHCVIPAALFMPSISKNCVSPHNRAIFTALVLLKGTIKSMDPLASVFTYSKGLKTLKRHYPHGFKRLYDVVYLRSFIQGTRTGV